MTRRELLSTISLPILAATLDAQESDGGSQNQGKDPRNILNGFEIPREKYSDQPYVVITKDGNWLCVLTTGKGSEGAPAQHIISTTSADKGRTWSTPIDIEPATGPEASWVMPLAIPGSGRVYVFYTYNADNLRLDTMSNSKTYAKRVDTMGEYAYKYTDDYGKSWSAERYFIPMRRMRIDRDNAYAGKRVYFWGVGKPIVTHNGAMFGFAKVGKWGDPGGMVTSQGCFMHSPNILTEKDPKKLKWNLLPEGDEGLRAPKGPVSDEANLVELNDGSLYATYRTIDGFNCGAYSRDQGRTWTPPAYAVYEPGGRPIKHPRAANFVRKFSNGKYLLWYHNHGGQSVLSSKWSYYSNRNPAWVSGGIERHGHIYWSQPEILLYHPDPDIRTSYPDFIEDQGEFYVTETIKTYARVHKVDRALLEALWNQAENSTRTQKGLVFTSIGSTQNGKPQTLPKLPSLLNGGFTIEFWIRLWELSADQTILDTRLPNGKGIAVTTSDRSTYSLTLNDGAKEATWDTDPGVHPGTLKVGVWQHVALVVDGGPKIITAIVDGILNDGGPARDYGWGRFPPELADVNGTTDSPIRAKIFGNIKGLRIYDRYLRTSEVVGNYRADLNTART
ncbi:MAG: BNR/Asp-box repeat protein [Bryobacterales bacterium]|nr:BNR/Asp-box repeat protein [Bryobacterales bacterium]